MQKIYNRTYWENLPSTNSEIDADNLNNIEAGIDALDNRTINIDATKATKTEVSTLISEIEWNEATGVITFTRKNGSKITIDTKLEKLAVNFGYDQEMEKLVITLSDGTIQYVDLSALITVYEFLDSDTIAFQLENGKVKAVVKEGSIEEKHLQPNYLADIRVETAASSANATAAANSAAASASSASAAKTSESNAASSATAAKTSETNASNSATAAASSATNANASSVTATEKATESADYAGNAKASANTASTHANTASSKASEASTSANRASIYADAATDSALLAESYAVGGTGTRENEDVDNARYYKEQAERISQGLSGALLPMGTITFSQLEAQTKQAGYMYNISDSFVTDSTFKEGPGYEYAAGTNVYYTADGYWDAIAGTNVTGVKGSEESAYRQGNVNITKANIGLGNVDNTSDANKPISTKQKAAIDLKLDKTGDSANNTTTFTSGDSANPTGWADIVTVGSGETHASLFRKVSLAIKNLRYLYKVLGNTDISSIGNGTVTSGLVAIADSISNVDNTADADKSVNYARTANYATYAASASQATNDANGNNIAENISAVNESLAKKYDIDVDSGTHNTDDPNTTMLPSIRTKHANCPSNDIEYVIFTNITDLESGELAERRQVAFGTQETNTLHFRIKPYGNSGFGDWERLALNSDLVTIDMTVTNLNLQPNVDNLFGYVTIPSGYNIVSVDYIADGANGGTGWGSLTLHSNVSGAIYGMSLMTITNSSGVIRVLCKKS